MGSPSNVIINVIFSFVECIAYLAQMSDRLPHRPEVRKMFAEEFVAAPK